MNCRDRDLVETTIFRVVETEICRDWPKIVEIEIFPRLSLISEPCDDGENNGKERQQEGSVYHRHRNLSDNFGCKH